ncbi:MAG: FGGY-family carbohydrate kinase [Paracoccaceae bacterium]|nr:MAG: FGGY-family carbohydrate kinase [Paracoccaceae bacterium]
MTAPLFIGVDVGTGSVRAGVFDAAGTLLGHTAHPIRIWRDAGGIVEQSSADIWAAVRASVAGAVAAAGTEPEQVAGIGFDATCSMVVVDREGLPMAVGPSEDPDRNVIVWMDHRATSEAAEINAGGHDVLRYVGGTISPEMQTPKLLWLARHRPQTFAQAGLFLDLPDYLTWRATGDAARSACTVVCKWTYLGHENRWDDAYFRAIGLGTLADEGFARIGERVADIGSARGSGLTEAAARDLGLRPGTAVGAALIDAHSGGVGSIGAGGADPSREMALIAGTSACTMTVTREASFVPGVWGPYSGAMLPGWWLNEGGQSAYGAALDHVLAMHPASAPASQAAAERSLPEYLEALAVARAGSVEAAAQIAPGLHVLPEFLGNRSPEADPHATAVIAGLRLETGIESLVDLFVATLRGLCQGTVDIVERLRGHGQAIDTIVLSGGAARSALLRRILSDATRCRVALSASPEPVLLGAAMLGAVASGHRTSLEDAASAMVSRGAEIAPDPLTMDFHSRQRRAHGLLKGLERHLRAEAG